MSSKKFWKFYKKAAGFIERVSALFISHFAALLLFKIIGA